MEYPKNGSVVIIDDKYEEISDLVKTLNKNKVPTLYFDGTLDVLPNDGFDNLRIVFLDINLENDSATSGNESQIISKLMSILKKLINKNNGKYIILIWSSMTNNYFELIKNAIEEDKEKDSSFLNNHPETIIEVNKSDVSNIGLIQEKINTTLDNSFLKYYILFENMILESTKEVLNDIDTIATTDSNILKTLSLFSDSVSLEASDKNPNSLLSNAFSNISHMLHEKIEKKTGNITRFNNYSQEEICGYAEDLESSPDINDITMLNTLYHIEDIQSNTLSSGNVYLYNDYLNKCCTTQGCNTKWAERLHEKIFDKDLKSFVKLKPTFFTEQYSALEESELRELNKNRISKADFIEEKINEFKAEDIINIFIEVSPTCDVAQNKWKKLKLVFGIMIPIDVMYDMKGDNFYNCNNLLINYNTKNYALILDIQTITAINFDVFSDIETIFKFKQELIVDIQHKIASHISRPGFFNMNDYLTK